MIQVHILKVKMLNFVNYCYVIANNQTRAALLIDPAWEIDTVKNILTTNNLIPAAILLTHHHPDHIHLAPTFAIEYGIPVYMDKKEIDFYSYECPYLHPLITDSSFVIQNITIKPISTPGHTYGSMCYLIDNHLFTGDTLFNEGCGMCLGKGADPYHLYASLLKLKQVISPHTIIYPGHCYGLTIGQTFEEVLKHNLYLQFEDVESFVAFRMRKVQNGLFNFK